MEGKKVFKCHLPDEQNDLIKIEASKVGMSRQKYIEKKIIEAHVIKLAKRIVKS